MAKYDPLHDYLINQSSKEVTFGFSELENMLGSSLPRSAYDSRQWWQNTPDHGHVQAQAWMSAGWKVDTVNFDDKWVRFIR